MCDRDQILLAEAYELIEKNLVVIPRRKWGDENSVRDINKRTKKPETYQKPDEFFKRFPIAEYDRNGAYFDIETHENLTGKIYKDGFIDTSNKKPMMQVNDDEVEKLSAGPKIETNLVKPIKFDWVEGGENQIGKFIATAEYRNDHFYALKIIFKTPVKLATNPDKASEPRLRPTATGKLSFGNVIGKIQIKNKQRYIHPCYDIIEIN